MKQDKYYEKEKIRHYIDTQKEKDLKDQIENFFCETEEITKKMIKYLKKVAERFNYSEADKIYSSEQMDLKKGNKKWKF